MIDTRVKIELKEELDDTPPVTPAKRLRRRSSYENPASVQSFTSTNVSEDSYAPIRKRGRPRVTVAQAPDPKQYSAESFKHAQARHKNNEASRRSRLNKKNREDGLMEESEQLEQRHRELVAQERKLARKAERWRQRVLDLAQLGVC